MRAEKLKRLTELFAGSAGTSPLLIDAAHAGSGYVFTGPIPQNEVVDIYRHRALGSERAHDKQTTSLKGMKEAVERLSTHSPCDVLIHQLQAQERRWTIFTDAEMKELIAVIESASE